VPLHRKELTQLIDPIIKDNIDFVIGAEQTL
jgi:hypothetical protein